MHTVQFRSIRNGSMRNLLWIRGINSLWIRGITSFSSKFEHFFDCTLSEPKIGYSRSSNQVDWDVSRYLEVSSHHLGIPDGCYVILHRDHQTFVLGFPSFQGIMGMGYGSFFLEPFYLKGGILGMNACLDIEEHDTP